MKTNGIRTKHDPARHERRAAPDRDERCRIAATLGPSYARRAPEPQLPPSEAYGLALRVE